VKFPLLIMVKVRTNLHLISYDKHFMKVFFGAILHLSEILFKVAFERCIMHKQKTHQQECV